MAEHNSPWRGRRVLVTGCTGFLGGAVARESRDRPAGRDLADLVVERVRLRDDAKAAPDFRAVVHRIEVTANGGSGPGTGDGLVNPLQAVTAILPARAAPSPSPSVRPQPVSVSRARPPDRATPATAAKVTAGALGAAVLVALGAVVISQGRRRRWRAGRTEVPAAGGDVADDPWS